MTELVLSVFPGLGLLDRAFELEGFCLVRGPDLLWGGDIHSFHPPPGYFTGVLGGPPCQAHSPLKNIIESNGYQTAPDLIPEFERVVLEAQPEWFVMENVPAAPRPSVPGYGVTSFVFDNRWAPEAPLQSRRRRFSLGIRGGRARLNPPRCEQENSGWEPAVTRDNMSTPVRLAWYGDYLEEKPSYGRRGIRQMLELQGLSPDYLDHCPLTLSGKKKAVANGVPIPMGRAIATAVRWIRQGPQLAAGHG